MALLSWMLQEVADHVFLLLNQGNLGCGGRCFVCFLSQEVCGFPQQEVHALSSNEENVTKILVSGCMRCLLACLLAGWLAVGRWVGGLFANILQRSGRVT